MSVTGKMKFFEKSIVDIDYESVSVTASSNSQIVDRIRDRKIYNKWISSGSDDSTQETITFTLNAEKSLDRLLLVKNNFKDFDVMYWDGGAFAHFTNVVTKEGTQSNVSETANTKETNYYEFDQVSTTILRLRINTTQTVDAEKEIYQFMAMLEIGTFTGTPDFTPAFEPDQSEKKILGGRRKFSIFDEAFIGNLAFQLRYNQTNDHDIVKTIWDSRKEFLFWLCGGDETQFRFSFKGSRLEDIYLVHISNSLSQWFEANVYVLGTKPFTINMVEVE